MLNNLPPEILLKIFSYLDFKDLVRCSETCVRFQDITSNDHLWQPLCEKHWLLKECATESNWKASFADMYQSWGQYLHCYSSLKSAWDKINHFMEQHCPQIHRSINPGVSEVELEEAEEKLNLKLPSDLRCSLRIHNGQRLSTFGVLGCVVIQDHFRCESLLDIQTVSSFQCLFRDCIPLTLCVDSGVGQFMALTDMNAQLQPGTIFYTCDVQDEGIYSPEERQSGIFLSGASFSEWLCKYADQLDRKEFLLDGHVFRFQDACEHELTTGNITVSVCTCFLPEFSSVFIPKFFHVYRITMRMAEDAPKSSSCRLESRHWIITDENGFEEQVNGPGVVGEFPVMKPGSSFSWISCTTFKTSKGNMRGHFTMRNLNTVPILLAYVYGVVPISLCRSGGCGVTTSASGVRIEFDEENEIGMGNSLAADGVSVDTAVSHRGVVNPSIGEVSFGMSTSVSLGSGCHLERVGFIREEERELSDRESASNTAIAGHSLTGSIASASITGGPPVSASMATIQAPIGGVVSGNCVMSPPSAAAAMATPASTAVPVGILTNGNGSLVNNVVPHKLEVQVDVSSSSNKRLSVSSEVASTTASLAEYLSTSAADNEHCQSSGNN